MFLQKTGNKIIKIKGNKGLEGVRSQSNATPVGLKQNFFVTHDISSSKDSIPESSNKNKKIIQIKNVTFMQKAATEAAAKRQSNLQSSGSGMPKPPLGRK